MVREFIYGWFAEKAGVSADEIGNEPDVNYFEQGLIDSFAFLELIGTCEEKFGMSFSDDDFQDEAIFTISGLIAIIEKSMAGR